MAKEGNETSSQSATHKGSPAGSSHEKGAGNLPVEDRDEATEDRLADEAQDAPQTHPNRNTSKGDAGKGSYS